MGLRILYNSLDTAYKRPFGVLTPGQSCKLRLSIPCDCRTKRAVLVVQCEDGAVYAEHDLSLSCIEPPYEHFELSFNLPEPGLFFYYFRITTPNETFRLLKQGEDTNMEAGDLWQLSCVSQEFPVPEDVQGRVFYQIFPDRFHQVGHCDCSGKLEPYWVHDDLTEMPVFRPNEQGEVLNNDFYGGNLSGITEKLPYLKELGVEGLYLNPIFMAFSSHRYDTADYKRIDPMLGTEEDFKTLCDTAHSLGMKVILDGVFSHTGSNSVYFDKNGVFGGGAVSDPQSPYRKWFDFKHYPDKYTCWWDFDTLPCVNKMEPGFMDYVFGADDSVLAKWLKLGADGFRLDVVDELPDGFLMALRRRLRQLKPDAMLIGEVWEDASNKIAYGFRRRYFTHAQLDSVMNYPWRKAILGFVRGDDDGRGLRQVLLTIAENYPAPVLNSNLNLLSSHDVPRAITALIDPTDAEREELARRLSAMTPEQLKLGKERFKLASFLQFTLPGCPCVYYGDEAGMTGYRDPFNRQYYPWGREDADLQSHIRTLARLRNGSQAMKRGDLQILQAGNGSITFRRTLNGERLWVRCGKANNPLPDGQVLFGGADEAMCIVQEA